METVKNEGRKEMVNKIWAEDKKARESFGSLIPLLNLFLAQRFSEHLWAIAKL